MAVTLDPAAFQSLQAAFSEVALRAERLQELVGLGEGFRALDTNFNTFNRNARTNPPADFPRLDDMWTTCRDFELSRLLDSIKLTKYVRQPLPGEPPDGRTAEVDGWSSDLEQTGANLQQAITDLSIVQVAKIADAFQSKLRKHQNRLKSITDREVRDLCGLTDKLKEVLA